MAKKSGTYGDYDSTLAVKPIQHEQDLEKVMHRETMLCCCLDV